MAIRYKFADVETAGFRGPDEHGSGVVDVAWVELDENINELSERSSLINPGRNIEESAQAVHGISDAEVAFAPTLEAFYKNNWDDSPTVLIAHNVKFDQKFLSGCIQVLSGTLCTLELARAFLPEAPNHKLVTLAEHYRLERGTAHRAAGDVRTGVALLRLIAERSKMTLPQLVQFQSRPTVLTVMPFGMHKGKAFSDLPASYLSWLLSTEGISSDVKMSADIALKLKA